MRISQNKKASAGKQFFSLLPVVSLLVGVAFFAGAQEGPEP